MPTREFEELVSEVTATIEQYVLSSDSMLSDADSMTDTVNAAVTWPVYAYVLDFEKIVWHFPDAPARLIEDAL